ncbi:MAG: hypothetical protein HOF35_01215, partial [Bacteroidetes bacterium]|nr:hypothetical protein [Bacteroidota bacterium]
MQFLIKKQIFLYTLLITLLFSRVFAVGESGAVFLLISPSPLLNGMGGVGAGYPVDDIFSSYYNPANSFAPTGLTYSYTKNSTIWLPNISDNIYLKYKIIKVSYRLKKSPFYFTMTQFKTFIDLGSQAPTNENGTIVGLSDANMKSTAISYSIGLNFRNFPLRVSIGRTDKKVKQQLFSSSNQLEIIGNSNDKLYDLGILVSFPYSITKKRKGISTHITPAIGFSQSNRGGNIQFGDSQDPAPRFARLGISLSAHMILDNRFKILNYAIAREAGDMLAERYWESDSVSVIRYQSGTGDINFKNHLIDSNASHHVSISQGQELGFMNTIFFRKGKFTDIDGYIYSRYSGWGFNLKGFLHLASHLTNHKKYSELSKFINIRYNQAVESSNEPGSPRDGITYQNFAFTLNNPGGFIDFINQMQVSLFAGQTHSTIVNNDVSSKLNNSGIEYGIELPKFMNRTGVITGIRYAQMGFKLNLPDDVYISGDLKVKLNYLRIYVYKTYEFAGFDFQTGPDLGYLINVNITSKNCFGENCYSSSNTISGDKWIDENAGNRYDIGWSAGIRLFPKSEYSMGLDYYYGFSNVFNTAKSLNTSFYIKFYWNIN